MDKCAVYLMQDGYSGDVKIGISKNPDLRRTQVQSHYNVGGVSLITKNGLLPEIKPVNTKSFSFSILGYLSMWWDENGSCFQQQIDGFLAWMKASTQSRVYKVEPLLRKYGRQKEDRRDC